LRRFGTPGPAEHRADDLGNDVARLAHDHHVAGTDVLDPHLILVVQGGHRDGGATDEDRFQRPNGVARPVRPIDTSNAQQLRRALLGRELEGNGPAGAREVAPNWAWRARSSTLVTTPSIS
jgi:hypothetical protein